MRKRTREEKTVATGKSRYKAFKELFGGLRYRRLMPVVALFISGFALAAEKAQFDVVIYEIR